MFSVFKKNKSFNIGIIGSDTLNSQERVRDVTDQITAAIFKHAKKKEIVIHTGNRTIGAERIARSFANQFDHTLTKHLPNYSFHGTQAHYQNHINIVKESDLVLIFWDGLSNESLYAKDAAEKYKKDYYLITIA